MAYSTSSTPSPSVQRATIAELDKVTVLDVSGAWGDTAPWSLEGSGASASPGTTQSAWDESSRLGCLGLCVFAGHIDSDIRLTRRCQTRPARHGHTPIATPGSWATPVPHKNGSSAK